MWRRGSLTLPPRSFDNKELTPPSPPAETEQVSGGFWEIGVKVRESPLEAKIAKTCAPMTVTKVGGACPLSGN